MKTLNLISPLALGLSLMLSAMVSTGARADITVRLDGPETLSVGQSATYAVFGSSDNDDILDGFGIVLIINGGPGIGFSLMQNDAFLTDADYVFFDRSGNVATGLSGTALLPGGSMSIADFSDDQSASPNPGMSDPFTFGDESRLLGRFSVDAVAPGSFMVAVDPATSFNDPSFGLVTFSSTPLNVTAVPEPSGLLGMSGVMGAVVWCRRRRVRCV